MPKTDTTSALPLHARGGEGTRRPSQRQLTFAHRDTKRTWRQMWLNLLRNWITASTGTPSDGLGVDVSDSGASVATFLAAQAQLDREAHDDEWFLDQVVVTGEEDGHRHGSEKGTGTKHTESEQAGSMHRGASGVGTDARDTIMNPRTPWEYIRWRTWPMVYFFFDPRFEDPQRELEFAKQSWYTNKRLSFYGALFLWLNWALYLGLNRTETRFQLIAYDVGLSIVSLPLPFLVAYNVPRQFPVLFQIWFSVAAWYCGILELIEMRECHFFQDSLRHCGTKDFLAMMYYNTALPSLMMFIISHRFYNATIALAQFSLILALIIPIQAIFSRVLIGYATFWIFMLGLHYSREMTDRRMYLLNSQLKVAYRAQQKAQIAESKASQAKRRFASYIFHEVRVPLNTAMLAFQNLQSSNAFKEEHMQSQNIEIYALDASLSMMQQVLNDVLDLERMEYGRFESNPRPFPLHRAISSILGPVGLASTAKRLPLRIGLDPKIDALADPDSDPGALWVVGDEIRLRQVLTNLASNAVKFTPEGAGEVAVTTALLDYSPGAPPSSKSGTSAAAEKRPPSHGSAENLASSPNGPRITFRLEVQDSGPGIRPSDLVEHRLFQPFVQTSVGKMSGKGTGLGLAIVRQIVTLSGGRLGVQSRKNKGALFWVELTFPLATSAEVRALREHGSGLALGAVSATPSNISLNRPSIAPLHADTTATAVNSILPDAPLPLQIGGGMLSASAVATLPLELKVDATRHRVAYGAPADWQEEHPLASAGSADSPPAPPTPGAGPPPATSMSSVHAPNPTGGSSILGPSDDPLRVLVVDDDPMTRALMSRMLSKLGCAVETADDGEQCLDLLLRQGRRFDLVSLDNFMPLMTGEEAVRRLREAGRRDLVVGCTGNALTEDQTSYIDAGADRILTKPIMLKDLKAVLQVALQRRSLPAPPQDAG